MEQILNKIPVGILGATGSVGQKFIQLLADHPYFEVTELAASEKSAGKPYKDAVTWFLPGKIPAAIEDKVVKTTDSDLECKLLFSGLDASVAGEIEENFACKGYVVVSNSKNHRFDTAVPLLIPEVNPDHLDLIKYQTYGKGCIVTNPNCSTIGMVMAVKPLLDRFGIAAINVVTLQAISGAGFPGLSSLSILENAIPNISGEEKKIETEPLKILGTFSNGEIRPLELQISAQCNRVPVIDGHLSSVQVRLKQKASRSDILDAWETFSAEPQERKLPFAPVQPIHYFTEPFYPQPRLHRDLEKGMAVSVGQLRECPIFDFKFSVLSHNTVRGAAGGAILCAELMKDRNLF